MKSIQKIFFYTKESTRNVTHFIKKISFLFLTSLFHLSNLTLQTKNKLIAIFQPMSKPLPNSS